MCDRTPAAPEERDTVGVNTRHHPRRHGEALVKARASFISISCISISPFRCFAWARIRQPDDVAASQIGRRRRHDLARPGFRAGLYCLSLATARFLSHVTTIAGHDRRCHRPMARHLLTVDGSSQRPIKGAAVQSSFHPTGRRGQPVALRNSFT